MNSKRDMEQVYSNRTTSSNDDDFQPKSADSTKDKSNLYPWQVENVQLSPPRDSRESPLFKRSTKRSLRPINYPHEVRGTQVDFTDRDEIPEISEPQDLDAFYNYCDEKVNRSYQDSAEGTCRPVPDNGGKSSSDSPEKGEQTSCYGKHSGRGRYRRRLRKKVESNVCSSTSDNGASFSFELRKIYEEINLDLTDRLVKMRESLENAKKDFDMQVKETASGLDLFNSIYRDNENTPRPSLRITELQSDTDEDRKSLTQAINTETRRISPSEMCLIPNELPTVCGPPERPIDRNLPIKKSNRSEESKTEPDLHECVSEISIKTSKSERSMKSRISKTSQKTTKLKIPPLQYTSRTMQSRREFDDIELINYTEQSESEKSVRFEESDSTVQSARECPSNKRSYKLIPINKSTESIESIKTNAFDRPRQAEVLVCSSANEKSSASKSITSILSSRSKMSKKCNSEQFDNDPPQNDQVNKCKGKILEPKVKPHDVILLQWHDQPTQITETTKRIRRAWLSDKKPWHERRRNLKQSIPPPLIQSSDENTKTTNKPTTQKKRTVPPYLTMLIPPTFKKHSTKVVPEENTIADNATSKSSSVCDSPTFSEEVGSSPEQPKRRNEHLKETLQPTPGIVSSKKKHEQKLRTIKPAKSYYSRTDKRSRDFSANNRNSHGLVELHLNSKSSCFFNAKSSIAKYDPLTVPEDLRVTKIFVCQSKQDQTLGKNLVSGAQEINKNTFNITDKNKSKLHGTISRDFNESKLDDLVGNAPHTLLREETFLVNKFEKNNQNSAKRHVSNKFEESRPDTGELIITDFDFKTKTDLSTLEYNFSSELRNSSKLDKNVKSSSSDNNSLNLKLHLSAMDLQEHSNSSRASRTKRSKHTTDETSDRLKKSVSTTEEQSSRSATKMAESDIDIKNNIKINRWIVGHDGYSESKSEPAHSKSVFVNMGLGCVNRLQKKQNITLQRSKTDSQIPNSLISGPLEAHHGDNWICDKVRDDKFAVSEKLLALENEEFDNSIDLRLKRGDFASQYTEAPIRPDVKTLESMGMTTRILERSWELLKTSPWEVYEREVDNSSLDIDEIINDSSSLTPPWRSCFRNMVRWFVIKCCVGSPVKNDRV